MTRWFSKRKIKESRETKILIANEVFEQNASRLVYLALLGIPISLIHIIVFALKLPEAESVTHTWRTGIILLHSAIIITIATAALASLSYKKTGMPGRKTTSTIFHLFYFALILIAVAITISDQLVTTTITPFLVVCTLLSVFFLMKPLWAIVYFGTGYVLLLLLMPEVQADSVVLLSNIFNSLTATAVAVLISAIMWNSFRAKTIQAFTIQEQTRLLEAKNRNLKEETKNQVKLLKTRDKILSIVAHDLKGPMTGVLGLSDILNENADQMTADQIKENTQLIRNSTMQTYYLLENLLEWARLQQNQIPFSPENQKLGSAVKATFRLFKENASRKKIRLVNELTEELTIWADKAMLSSILRNLVSNAIKFTGEGGVISVSAQKEERVIQFSVTDSGVGITPEKLNNLFAEDAVKSTFGTENEKGTGLGLVLCKEFAEKHGGNIIAESEVGKGSTFTVTIPLPRTHKA
ncbi:Signal transduction histidine kinase [Mariniphaga anaerophila]|uniref:histidine kinase n=1 Tax=Mariniphaga anaerophila TaxID=1484053 RepID=A0A1M4WDF3_9BACT|nr:HAMP domain-containing sensor histidine kinase [Mariniphaga anaerophila]SHE79256.1 Signal transduction histidine kinase [Mariniphaga anaerophila]